MRHFLNAKHTMQALIDGKCITGLNWPEKDFVFLNEEGNIVNQRGYLFNMLNFDNTKYYIWEPPKRKINMFKFAYQTEKGIVRESSTFHEDAIQFRAYMNGLSVPVKIKPETIQVLEYTKIQVEVG